MINQHSSRIKRFLPFVGAIFIVGLLLRQISLHLILQLLTKLQLEWVGVGLGWYVITLILRAYRFGTLLNLTGWSRPLALLPDMLLLSLLNNLLPARAGELSFPVMMHRHHHVPVSESVIVLFIARFFDFLCVIALL